MIDKPYPRDMVGYGRNPPDAAWPEGAHIAVQFVVTSVAEGFAQGHSLDVAASKMKVAPGFEVELFAGEPLVRQPVSIEFDDRGRMWVMQYLQRLALIHEAHQGEVLPDREDYAA